jgi:hypothetical protein
MPRPVATAPAGSTAEATLEATVMHVKLDGRAAASSTTNKRPRAGAAGARAKRPRAKLGKNKMCEHGRRKTRCRDCGGGSMCVCFLLRAQSRVCSSCTPVGVWFRRAAVAGTGHRCDHGRIRTACVDCSGGAICEHKRQRFWFASMHASQSVGALPSLPYLCADNPRGVICT